MYKNLRAEMVRKGLSNKAIAEVLKIDISTVSAKLNFYDRLKYCEAKEIQSKLFPDLTVDYLFETENIKSA